MSFSQVYGIVSGRNAWNDALFYGCSWFTNLILMLCDRLSSFHRWRVQETLMTLKFASRARPLDLAWLGRCGDADENSRPKAKTITNDVKRKMIAKAPAA